MLVRQGWSGEIAPNTWAKADVELEEIDVIRLLTSAAITPFSMDVLPVHLVYQLLEAEAEALLTAKLVARYGMKDGAAKLSRLAEVKQKTLEAIRACLT